MRHIRFMILAVAVALSALTGAAAQSRSQTTAAWGERPLRKSPVNFAVKTNLLYTAISQTPNLGFEFGAGRRSTINIAGGYNPWNLDGLENEGANKKLVHWAVAAEYRYWLCEKFNGHFFGAHVLAGKYNIGGYELPLLFGEGSKAFRQEGSAAGAGVGYGYQWMLGTHWNLEAVLGVGYLQFKYDQYDCPKCGSKIGQVGRNYFGPTNMGVTVMYLF